MAADLFGRRRTRETLAVLEEAWNKVFPEGAKGRGVRLVHDSGSEFTSRRFSEFARSLKIQDIVPSAGILSPWGS